MIALLFTVKRSGLVTRPRLTAALSRCRPLQVTGEGYLPIQQLVSPLVEAWKIFQPRVRLAATGAPLEGSACTALLVGQEILLEDRRHYAPQTRCGEQTRCI